MGQTAIYAASVTSIKTEYSVDNGQTWVPAQAPASVAVRMHHYMDNDGARILDTEMTLLTASGGDLPAGVMLRESPARSSMGGHFTEPAPQGFAVESFFDVFLELSVDGGANWFRADRSVRMEHRKVVVNPIPTVSQWGLFIFGLLLPTIGTIFILRRRSAPMLATTTSAA